MTRRSPLSWAAGIFLILLLMAGSFYFGRLFQQTAPSVPASSSTLVTSPTSVPLTETSVPQPKGIVWEVSVESIPQFEAKQFEHAITMLDTKSLILPNTHISITSAVTGGDWAVLYGQSKVNPPYTFQTTGVFTFLAHKDASGWNIITTEDTDFCDTLHQVPENVMSQDAKDYFRGCFK